MDKLVLAKQRNEVIHLLQSGQAALNKKGEIVHYSKAGRGHIRFTRNEALSIPEPVKKASE
jgi:hypothetical protein